MILRPSLVFGEHWEDGGIIQHKTNTYRYWKKKLKREISRALAMRDQQSLASLVHSTVFLRDIHRESVINSRVMILLMSGLSTILPDNDGLRAICTEYYSKMTKSHTVHEQKQIIGEFCHKNDLESSLNSQVDFVVKRSRSSDYHISTLSELRIAVDLFDEQGNDKEKLHILRADYAARVNVLHLVNRLKKSDYHILINRVDKLTNDLESWKSLEKFLSRLEPHEDIADIKTYVKSYWPKYHLQFNVSGDVETIRQRVFEILTDK